MKLWQAFLFGVALQFATTRLFQWIDRCDARRRIEAQKHINGGKEDV